MKKADASRIKEKMTVSASVGLIECTYVAETVLGDC